MKRILFAALFVLANISTSAFGAEAKKEAGTFLTPEAGGLDYKLQGEYLNDWGGAQVVALGNDKFRLILYKGGLPGAGWDKTDRTENEGVRKDNVVQFASKPPGWSHVLAEGVLKTQNPEGETYTMNKTLRLSPTLAAKPPEGTVVLFDGSNVDAWQSAHLDERNLLTAGAKTKRGYTNFTLHAEFMTPFKPTGRGQDRGNSGVYLQDRYEVQVLDSFGLKGEDNECGGIYSQAKPSVNMCYPPLTWQTYDIDFQAARFDDRGLKATNAIVTVKHNGVVIHDKLELKGPTGGGKAESPSGGAIQLQGHGNPVFYKNVWIVEKP